MTDVTQREIAQALSGLEPAIDVKVEYIDVPEHPGNKVIAMWFDGWVWGKQPYTYHGCPYYKPESVTRQMPPICTPQGREAYPGGRSIVL